MKAKEFMLTLLVLFAPATNSIAEVGDDYYPYFDYEAWLKEVHYSAPQPSGILWVENVSDGIAIRAQSDYGIGLEAISNNTGLALQAVGASYFEENVGIGDMPQSNSRLFVKTRNPYMNHSIYAEGGLGLKSVSTIDEGTGITGEGGHAGVCGYGYIGLIGYGYYGGWFEGNGYFSGNVGIGTTDMENRLHVNGAINLDPIPEPDNPSSGFVIYCDSVDGVLKAKAHTGTVTYLANP
jgi:hypothetical protein